MLGDKAMENKLNYVYAPIILFINAVEIEYGDGKTDHINAIYCVLGRGFAAANIVSNPYEGVDRVPVPGSIKIYNVGSELKCAAREACLNFNCPLNSFKPSSPEELDTAVELNYLFSQLFIDIIMQFGDEIFRARGAVEFKEPPVKIKLKKTQA